MSSILSNIKWFCGMVVFLYPRRQLCYNKATAGGFVQEAARRREMR